MSMSMSESYMVFTYLLDGILGKVNNQSLTTDALWVDYRLQPPAKIHYCQRSELGRSVPLNNLHITLW